MISHSTSESMDAGPMAGIGARRMAEKQEARMREWQQQERARLAHEQRQHREQQQQQKRIAAERQAYLEQQQQEARMAEERQAYVEHQRQLARQASAKVIADARPSIKESNSTMNVSASREASSHRHEASNGSASSEASSSRPRMPAVRAYAEEQSSSSHRSSGQSSASSSGRSQVLRWDRTRRPTPKASPELTTTALPTHTRGRSDSSVAHPRSRVEGSPSHSRGPSDGDCSTRMRSSTRDTAQSVPKATCADCGERLPFDTLVGHACQAIRFNAAEARPSENKNSLQKTLQDETRHQPFFARYEEAYDGTSHSATITKAQEQEQLDEASLKRRRQIEAQRAAKRQQSLGEQVGQVIPMAAPMPTEPIGSKAAWQPQHRRNAPGSQSSASTASSKLSIGSMFSRSHAETLTPSSSNEQFQHSRLGSHDEDTCDVEVLRKEKVSEPEVIGLDSLELAIDDMLRDSSNKITRRGETKHDKAPKNSSSKDAKGERQAKQSAKLCSVCLVPFERGQPLVTKNGKLFCVEDYAELYLEKCRKCCQPVRNVGVRSRDGALPGLFHRECFSCLACDAHFDDGTFYVYDNAPYCAHDYHRLNGTLCAGCDKGIEGQCRQLVDAKDDKAAVSSRYHPRCFTCQYDDGREFCKDALQDYFVVDGKRMCEWHFGKITKARAALTRARQALDRSNGSASGDADHVAAAIRSARRTTLLRTFEPCKAMA